MKELPRFELVKREEGGEEYYAARCNSLGLTAYGKVPSEAMERLKKMFSMLVDMHFKRFEEKDGIT